MRPPVLVIGHSGAENARALVAAWPRGGARLLTPASFARAKLSWRVDANGRATSAIGAAPADAGAITGVVTLIEGVDPSDLPRVADLDRGYVAGEMTAFLSVWLHSSRCPKLNPPSLTSLCGERDFLLWRADALACGSSVRAVDFSEPWGGNAWREDSAIVITLVGDRVIGSSDPETARFARAMADRARLPMLSLKLERTPEGFDFVAATAVPDVTDPEVAEAIFAFFGEAER